MAELLREVKKKETNRAALFQNAPDPMKERLAI
jgi:hypothetical protein